MPWDSHISKNTYHSKFYIFQFQNYRTSEIFKVNEFLNHSSIVTHLFLYAMSEIFLLLLWITNLSLIYQFPLSKLIEEKLTSIFLYPSFWKHVGHPILFLVHMMKFDLIKVVDQIIKLLIQFLRIGGVKFMKSLTQSITPFASRNTIIFSTLSYLAADNTPHRAMISALLFFPCPPSHQKWKCLRGSR